MVRETILRTIFLLAVVWISGCTTMRTMASGDLQTALDSLRAGDQVAIRSADTWQENLTVESVTDSSIRVEDARGERVTFDRSEIVEIKVRVSAPGKTAALAAGIFFGVLGSGIPGLSL
jgi:preprotein translocase subunit YajC